MAAHYSKHQEEKPKPLARRQQVITRHLSQQLPANLKQLLTRAISLMCAIDGRSFNIVYGDGFKHAMEVGVLIGAMFGHFPIDHGLPCPTTIANNLEPLVKEAEVKLKAKLALLPAIALTTDHYKDSITQVCTLIV